MSKTTDTVARLAEPVVKEAGCTLWDVEYVKEAGTYYLRVFIDKEGGVGIDDCEAVSRALDPILDEADPIEGSYTFEVGSAGIERELKKPEHFAAYIGSEVEVRTYKPIDGQKVFVGTLSKYGPDGAEIIINGKPVLLSRADIAVAKLHITF